MRKLRVYLGHVTHLSGTNDIDKKVKGVQKCFQNKFFFRNISHFCLRDLSANFHKGGLT